MQRPDEEWVARLLELTNEISGSFDATLTPEERAALPAAHESETEPSYPAAERETAMLEFAAGGMETLVHDIRWVIDQRNQKLYRQCLEVYYKAEKLARDPQHADLIEVVEQLRHAHLQQYGCPIPPRDPTLK